jgi:TRAP-type C4-dicarboxylate transport system substrate-binding protein
MSSLSKPAGILCAAAIALAACGGAPQADKSGAAVKSKVTLTLQMPDAADALGERFAADVARRSDGSVTVKIDRRAPYDSRDPANELKLARALQSGREDIGYLPARAWAADGLPAFKALLAPFLVTTYPAAQAVATGRIADAALSTLPPSVVGVALVPAEVRRVLARWPPASPDAFDGLRVRVIDNPQTAADFLALGAVPVQGLLAGDVYTRMRSHRLDAAESSPSYVLANSYAGVARYLSSYALFPKFQSIVVSAMAWKRLAPKQQDAVRAAARDTVAAAGTQVPAQERTELAQLCHAGIRLTVPTAPQLHALAASAALATEGLGDPAAAKVLGALRKLPGAGPQGLASPLPADCRNPPPAALAAKPGQATIPNGVYVIKTTVADLRAGAAIGPDFNRDIVYRTTLRNGRWYQTQTPNYPDQGPFSGTYTIDGDEVRFVMLHAAGALVTPETVKWSYFNKRLRFRIVDVADSASRVLYTAHPWRKVG